jgi:hypothetical protein
MRSEMPRADEVSSRDTRLDVKALRLATHGWLLGNPLVYKPGADDLTGIARELAQAGAATGTLVLGGASLGGVEAILILRLAMSRTALGEAAAIVIADVARETFGGSGLVEEQDEWRLVLMTGGVASSEIAQVALDEVGGAALLRLRVAFDALESFGRETVGKPITPLLARPDWREVFLARVLHALDIRLQTLPPA